MWAKEIGRRATSTLPSGGVPNAKHEEIIRNGYFTPAILAAYIGAKWLNNHCCLSNLQHAAREEHRNGYLTLYGPHVGKMGT